MARDRSPDVHDLVELTVIDTKLSGPFRQRGTVELGSEAPRVLRAAERSATWIEAAPGSMPCPKAALTGVLLEAFTR